MVLDYESHAQDFIARYALAAYRAGKAAHVKSGRLPRTYRYTPDAFHQQFIEALGLHDDAVREETVKAMMLFPEMFRD